MSIQVVNGKVLSEEEVAAMEAVKAAEVPAASVEEGPLPEDGTGHDPIMPAEEESVPVNVRVVSDGADGELVNESLDTVPSDEGGPEVENPAE